MKAKYKALEEQLQAMEDLQRDYDTLRAQFEAAIAVATINTPEEHEKADVSLA